MEEALQLGFGAAEAREEGLRYLHGGGLAGQEGFADVDDLGGCRSVGEGKEGCGFGGVEALGLEVAEAEEPRRMMN